MGQECLLNSKLYHPLDNEGDFHTSVLAAALPTIDRFDRAGI